MKKLLPTLLPVLLLGFVAGAAQAGGLERADTAVNEFTTWLYRFLGLCAVIYLTFKMMQLWGDKIQLLDLGMAIGKVAVGGGVLVLATWAWGLFA